jgi:hypothetical protein
LQHNQKVQRRQEESIFLPTLVSAAPQHMINTSFDNHQLDIACVAPFSHSESLSIRVVRIAIMTYI